MKDIKKIIAKFKDVRIMVVGDLILDQYIRGEVDRVSPEAPVPIVWARERRYVPGGAANVANNIVSLGGKASLCAVTGDKNTLVAELLLRELKAGKIDTAGIISERGRETTLKTRVIAGHQQVVRVDWEHVHNISKETQNKLRAYITKNLKYFDAVIIEDYGKGLLGRGLTEAIIKEANNQKKIVTVDPKEDNFDCYFKATCITPNRREAQNAVRFLKMKDASNKFRIYKEELTTDKDISRAGEAILGHLQLESLLITMGEHGMWLFEKGRNRHIPTVAQEVFDVSGAGDTVIAALTMALSCGASKLEAAHIANFAAGIVVGKLGTAVTTQKELLGRINISRE
ncbi:MAG: D-glycero-beta-D-manno-heptose-7-phosphate kinase [Candidatus Omnitrophica bacterium]|nr:D-glycero-beta-D-manno-heptose-7-phosphate kinase [Candidatus Omnitrophota bacterium]MDD5552407.1 D-glycero-beta-D-manno-heptose-7-phosphate kinase [Candidatus Omnitrophota bacterium]